MASNKIYVVVGEWRGIVDEVKVFKDKKRAEVHRDKLTKEYGKEKVKIGEATVQIFDEDVR